MNDDLKKMMDEQMVGVETDGLYVPFRTVRHERGELTEVVQDDIEFCCDELKDMWQRTIGTVSMSENEVDTNVYQFDTSPGMNKIVSYCPFCGSDITTEHIGTFEERTVYERVDE